MRAMARTAVAAAMMMVAAPLHAQPAQAQAQAQAEPVAREAAPAGLPARSEVRIEIGAVIDSKTAVGGTRFPIRLAEPIVVDGQVILPAGLVGEGEIVHAAKARWGGKPGELVLAARHLDCGGQRIALGWTQLGGAGANNVAEAAVATALFTPAAFLIAGGEMRIPMGTRATARTRLAFSGPAGATACAPSGSTANHAQGDAQ